MDIPGPAVIEEATTQDPGPTNQKGTELHQHIPAMQPQQTYTCSTAGKHKKHPQKNRSTYTKKSAPAFMGYENCVCTFTGYSRPLYDEYHSKPVPESDWPITINPPFFNLVSENM